MKLDDIALNIRKDESSIYYAKSDSHISYPDDGNEMCMQLEEDSFWFIHRNNIIAQSVKKYSKDKVFFDIGGGNGFVSKRLQDEGIQVILVEPGKTGAVNAYKRGINNVLCSTLENAEFLPEQIESVGLFDVVEHIEDDHSFLKNINKYMKDGGVVYITVPAYNLLWSNEDDDAGHFKRYTLSTMESVLKKSGFSVVYSTYFFSILPFPILLFRSIPSRLGFNKNSKNVEKHQKEHKPNVGFVNSMLQRIWKWEQDIVKQDKKIPLGGSCFVIAKKMS